VDSKRCMWCNQVKLTTEFAPRADKRTGWVGVNSRCKRCATAAAQEARKTAPKEPQQRPCAICGRTFTARNRLSHYCSVTCRQVGQIGGPYTCRFCEEEFFTQRSNYLRGSGYCSIRCSKEDLYQDAHERLTRRCLQCGKTFFSYRKESRYCSRSCVDASRRDDRLPQRRRHLQPQRYAEVVRILLEAQDFRCAYCQCEIATKQCHRDHIIPLIRGGEDSLDNSCLACVFCNSSKHSHNLEDWLARHPELHPLTFQRPMFFEPVPKIPCI
jgi:5-methylcytosine-specific restriction endonuclease McrA